MSSSVTQQRLARITALLRRYDETDIPADSAEAAARESLLRLQASLIHEARLHEGKADVVVRFQGGGERHHAIDAAFVGGFLTELQNVLAATAQALIHGVATDKGSLPADVIEASRLRVATFAPGSFTVLADGPFGRAVQLTISDEENWPPFDTALDRVMDVLVAAEGTEEGPLLAAIAELRSKRAAARLEELGRHLARTGTNATVVQRNVATDRPREARVTSGVAQLLVEALSRSEQEVRTVYLTGQLTGVRWARGIFDLEIPHGDEVELLSGRITADLRAAVQPAFDRFIRAELEVTTIRSRGDEWNTYLLTGLSPAPEDRLPPETRA